MDIPNSVDNMLLWIKMAPESTSVDIVCEVCCYFVYLPFSSTSWANPERGTRGPKPPGGGGGGVF